MVGELQPEMNDNLGIYKREEQYSLFLEHDGDESWMAQSHSQSISVVSTLRTARLVRRGRRGEGLTVSRAENVMLQALRSRK